MIGIKFKIPNEYGNVLYKILEGIDVAQYYWNIVTDDIVVKRIENQQTITKDRLFDNQWLTGNDFLKIICQSYYYLIFVDVKAFPENSCNIEINTFDEFMDSNCNMMVLCNDSVHASFFCKDSCVVSKVYNNCIAYGFKEVELIPYADGHKYDMYSF